MVCTLSFGEISNIHDGLHIRLASALLIIVEVVHRFRKCYFCFRKSMHFFTKINKRAGGKMHFWSWLDSVFTKYYYKIECHKRLLFCRWLWHWWFWPQPLFDGEGRFEVTDPESTRHSSKSIQMMQRAITRRVSYNSEQKSNNKRVAHFSGKGDSCFVMMKRWFLEHIIMHHCNALSCYGLMCSCSTSVT